MLYPEECGDDLDLLSKVHLKHYLRPPLQFEPVQKPCCRFVDIERELVVGQHISAALFSGEMRQRHRRDRLHPKQFGSFHTAMTCNDFAFIGDEHRIGEPEPLDTVGNLTDLLFRMRPRITGIGAQRAWVPLNDLMILALHIFDPANHAINNISPL